MTYLRTITASKISRNLPWMGTHSGMSHPLPPADSGNGTEKLSEPTDAEDRSI
jgi:hypothetical protein